MKLTPTKRDELLIRLDERVQDIREDTLPKIEQHLLNINSHLDDHSHRITTMEAQGKSKKEKIGLGGAIGTAIVALVMTIGQRVGWW